MLARGEDRAACHTLRRWRDARAFREGRPGRLVRNHGSWLGGGSLGVQLPAQARRLPGKIFHRAAGTVYRRVMIPDNNCAVLKAVRRSNPPTRDGDRGTGGSSSPSRMRSPADGRCTPAKDLR